MEFITFETEDGEKLELGILDETKVNGVEYILVTEDTNEDSEEEVEVMILRCVPDENEDEELETFVTVDDPEELEAVSKVFAEQLAEEEIDLEI
ncbi:MAG: DUF1292 domain-containing protein [Clostridiales bacterium]|nr:DUF1292 domain-containing protein [Clostridiales bacterium]MBS5878021.1 DUF1292 domain-containing protein [Clostridiales bacterium]MDU3489868.1 DUF1292 domain-containing protein [Clostridiales bacterium]